MIQKKVIGILIFILLAQSPLKSFAWGETGHQIIVELALQMLSPEARKKVLFYLKGYPTDRAAVWMDSVRGKNLAKYRYMKEWHYINMEPVQNYDQVASDQDLVYNLQRVIGALNHSGTLSPDSVQMNLRILFHLCGDITQPLHCGYGSDKGANDIHVSTPKYNISKNNLHHVWDDAIIQEGKITSESVKVYYQGLTPARIRLIQNGSARDWMADTRKYLVSNVYTVPGFTIDPKVVTPLSISYLDSNVGLVNQQLTYGAVRLAYLLEQAFGSHS